MFCVRYWLLDWTRLWCYVLVCWWCCEWIILGVCCLDLVVVLCVVYCDVGVVYCLCVVIGKLYQQSVMGVNVGFGVEEIVVCVGEVQWYVVQQVVGGVVVDEGGEVVLYELLQVIGQGLYQCSGYGIV